DRLTVHSGKALPPGWKGKVWAMQQGMSRSEQRQSECLLLTDADIAYAPGVVRAIVRKLCADRLELVSLMAKLHVVSAWDRLLLPAFVYFFSKLYPFRFVNDPNKATAGAAGGCVLLRRRALQDAGGLKQVANEIIDDCALAKLIKGSGGRIWIGMTDDVNSIRPYESLANIWNTVARTAFDQLGYSVTALFGTVLGMLFVYLVPPVASIIGATAVATLGLSGASLWLLSVCFFAWALMSMSYLPILRRYRVSYLFALLLPISAMVYTAMTVSSALRYWQGHGGEWKGRTYERAFRRRSG
ncbi:MAG: glycosyltransferase, partial [Candidatus Bipolaricaulota bacterium]